MDVAGVQCGHAHDLLRARVRHDRLLSPLHVKELFVMLQGDDYKPCTTYAARFLDFEGANISSIRLASGLTLRAITGGLSAGGRAGRDVATAILTHSRRSSRRVRDRSVACAAGRGRDACRGCCGVGGGSPCLVHSSHHRVLHRCIC
jgi:hypothetical protein